MGSFSVAANGVTSQAADINQFYTALTGGAATAFPVLPNIPSSNSVALQLTLPPWQSGNTRDFIICYNTSGELPRVALSYDAGGTGLGYIYFSDGTSANSSLLRGATNGLYTTAAVAVGGNLVTNGGTQPATMQVNGNFTVGGNLTMGAASAPTVSALAAGAPMFAQNGGTTFGLQVVDNGNTVLTLAPYNSNNGTSRGLATYNWNGGWVLTTTIDSNGAHTSGLDLYANSITRISYPSGSGSGTFSHGLNGTAPTDMGITSTVGSGTANVTAYGYWGSSNNFSVTANGSWRAIAFAY